MPKLLLRVKEKKRIFNDTKEGVVYQVKAEVVSGKVNQPLYEKTTITLAWGNSTVYNKIPDKSFLKLEWSITQESHDDFQEDD